MKRCTYDDFELFHQRWRDGLYPHQRLGQAFVNEFREPGDPPWPELFYANQDTALALIWTQAISA